MGHRQGIPPFPPSTSNSHLSKTPSISPVSNAPLLSSSHEQAIMIRLPREITTGTLVDYLSLKEIINLSSVNVQFRLLLMSHAFPCFSFKNWMDPNHKNWKYGLSHQTSDDPSHPLTRLPPAAHQMNTLSVYMPLLEHEITPLMTAAMVHHAGSDDPLFEPDVPLEVAQLFFSKLAHLIITSREEFIPDPKTWGSISFDSLLSLAVPLFLGAQGTPQHIYMSSICTSLTSGNNSCLRSLSFTDSHFEKDQVEGYTLNSDIVSLISSELLPRLSTVRVPLVLVPDDIVRDLIFDRRPLLRQLLIASANHAIANNRGTPWRLGHCESYCRSDICTASTRKNCMCPPPITTLTSKEYRAILKTAYHATSYIRVPEFFTPLLTVNFSNSYYVRIAIAHGAAKTPLTSVELTFPPPLYTTLFAAITRLTLLLPRDKEDLTAYQPHIMALPRTFPALTYLAMLLPRIPLENEFFLEVDATPAAMFLPAMKLHTLDINARVVGVRRPCGHCAVRFGRLKAECLIIRDMVSCPCCWDPIRLTGTKRIDIHGFLGIPQTESIEAWTAEVQEMLEDGGREVNVAEDFIVHVEE